MKRSKEETEGDGENGMEDCCRLLVSKDFCFDPNELRSDLTKDYPYVVEGQDESDEDSDTQDEFIRGDQQYDMLCWKYEYLNGLQGVSVALIYLGCFFEKFGSTQAKEMVDQSAFKVLINSDFWIYPYILVNAWNTSNFFFYKNHT